MTTLEHIEAMNKHFSNMTDEEYEFYKQQVLSHGKVSKAEFNKFKNDVFGYLDELKKEIDEIKSFLTDDEPVSAISDEEIDALFAEL